MDSGTPTPPARFLPTSTKKLSTRAAQASLVDFLAEFEHRSSPLKGGDNAVTVQLHKLSKALAEERAKRPKDDSH
ncbi:hypothetical protein EW146_g3857 [Bondarzewia mesenterica]|uniref:Uncharacterized protein n=1 Tax=Bondarzewia mesenterica TaxID=1095465 RepID=A0A4S4LWB9_9AGAM|nr:hypothetical protein EW146_g3857 [Bondarzewia mesenterica]